MTTRKRKPPVDWTFVRDDGNELYCARCGESARVGLPMALTKWCAKVAAFNVLHADCARPAGKKGDINADV